MFFDNLPEARAVGIGRYALEHQRGRAVRKRTVDNIAVAGDPADIGGAPVDVTILVIEYILMGHRGVDHIAAGGVKHTLRLAGRSRSIEDEHRILGIHLFGRAVCRRPVHRLMIPDIATVDPADVAAGAAHDDDLVAVRTGVQGGVGIGFQWYRFASTKTFVGGDHHVGIAILNAAGKRVRREAAKHHRMHRADPRTGKHGHGGLGDHRHIDGDPVTLLCPFGLQHVGKLAHFFVELGIADMAGIGRVVAFPDDRGLRPAGGEMPVKAVGGGIQRAVRIPADVKVALVV